MMARSNTAPRAPSGPFARPLNVDIVRDDGLERTVEATPDECAAVADDIGLPAVDALKATLVIERRAGGLIEVTGDLAARVIQTCVVSLEPFESDVRQRIELRFVQEPRVPPDIRGSRLGRMAERQVPAPPVAGNDDQEDPPDPIVDDTIDLGAIAVEFLNLALDPHPKKPGTQFTGLVAGEEEDARPSPFAALANLKGRS